jgi:hypothetical protein
MKHAKGSIDEAFGEGHALAHPELIGSAIIAQRIDHKPARPARPAQEYTDVFFVGAFAFTRSSRMCYQTAASAGDPGVPLARFPIPGKAACGMTERPLSGHTWAAVARRGFVLCEAILQYWKIIAGMFRLG